MAGIMAPIIMVIVLIGLMLIMLTFSLMSQHRVNKGIARNKIAGTRIVLGETLSYEHRKVLEQEEFARRLMLRNKTFELYEQVRRNAESAKADKAAGSVQVVKSAESVETSTGPHIDRTLGNLSANTT